MNESLGPFSISDGCLANSDQVDLVSMTSHERLAVLAFLLSKAVSRVRKQTLNDVESAASESSFVGLEPGAESRPHGTGPEMNTVPEE